MIIGIFHQGSGLGNQLARYVATRVRALDLGVDYAMFYNADGSGKEEGFKGKFFLNQPNWYAFQPSMYHWEEKKITKNGVDIRSYDPEFNFIKDNTAIDGEFQDERYWEHREKEVDEWLKVEPIEVPDDTCVLGFRGGEFSLYPDLFLTKEYWAEAMNIMVSEHGIQKFEIHTDDEVLAKEFFSQLYGGVNSNGSPFRVVHDIGINWRSMRSAKHAVIANSSFFILPRWLRNGITIAPRYWGRRNVKVWSLSQNFYKRFKYI